MVKVFPFSPVGEAPHDGGIDFGAHCVPDLHVDLSLVHVHEVQVLGGPNGASIQLVVEEVKCVFSDGALYILGCLSSLLVVLIISEGLKTSVVVFKLSHFFMKEEAARDYPFGIEVFN